jgi:hypothetical protein
LSEGTREAAPKLCAHTKQGSTQTLPSFLTFPVAGHLTLAVGR